MNTLSLFLHNEEDFIKKQCPELHKVIQETLVSSVVNTKDFVTNPLEEDTMEAGGFVNNICVRNIALDKSAKTFRAESIIGFNGPKGVIAIINEVIDQYNGRSIGGNAATIKSSNSLVVLLNLDISSYEGLPTFKPMVKTNFYWTETNKEGSIILKEYEEQQQYLSDGNNTVENITVEFPNSLKLRDETVILYGREAEKYYDNPDKEYPDVKVINGKLPVYMPFCGSVRVKGGTIVNVDKDKSLVRIEHPVNHTKAEFSKDKGNNWKDIKWNYIDNGKILHWAFPENWRTEIDLTNLKVASSFDFYAELALGVKLDDMPAPISISIYMGNTVIEDSRHLKVKKLYLQWGCLGKDTVLVMADGTQKRICDVHVGDAVSTGKGSAKIIAKYSGTEDNIIHIVTESGKKILVTDGHPILTERGWIRALDMNAADKVIMADGKSESLNGFYQTVYGEKTYNLELEGDNHQLIADGIVVGDYGRQNQPIDNFEETVRITGQEQLASEFQVLVDKINKNNNWK